MVLCVHGEVTDPEVDMFDREAVFIDRVLAPLDARLPGAEDRLRAHHDRRGGPVRRKRRRQRRRDGHAAAPHHQSQRDVRRRTPAARLLPAGRQARGAPARGAQGGDLGIAEILPRHRQRAPCARGKESACGCAGIFNAPFALESYAAVFEEEGALDKSRGVRVGATGPASTACRSTRARSRWSVPTMRCLGRGRRRRTGAVPRRRDARAGGSRLISAAPRPGGADHRRVMILEAADSIHMRGA